jgi:hypothetical protein
MPKRKSNPDTETMIGIAAVIGIGLLFLSSKKASAASVPTQDAGRGRTNVPSPTFAPPSPPPSPTEQRPSAPTSAAKGFTGDPRILEDQKTINRNLRAIREGFSLIGPANDYRILRAFPELTLLVEDGKLGPKTRAAARLVSEVADAAAEAEGNPELKISDYSSYEKIVRDDSGIRAWPAGFYTGPASAKYAKAFLDRFYPKATGAAS